MIICGIFVQIRRQCLHFSTRSLTWVKISDTENSHSSVLLMCSFTDGYLYSWCCWKCWDKADKIHYHHSLVWGPTSLFGVYVLHWNLHFALFFWPHILDFLGHVSCWLRMLIENPMDVLHLCITKGKTDFYTYRKE